MITTYPNFPARFLRSSTSHTLRILLQNSRKQFAIIKLFMHLCSFRATCSDRVLAFLILTIWRSCPSTFSVHLYTVVSNRYSRFNSYRIDQFLLFVARNIRNLQHHISNIQCKLEYLLPRFLSCVKIWSIILKFVLMGFSKYIQLFHISSMVDSF